MIFFCYRNGNSTAIAMSSGNKSNSTSSIQLSREEKLLALKQSLSMDNDKQDDKKSDSMQLLVMRLKSLIENTIDTQQELEMKLKVLSLIDIALINDDAKSNDVDLDVDLAFADEGYTIGAMKESLQAIKNDKNQIQVYKQALTAFETVCVLLNDLKQSHFHSKPPKVFSFVIADLFIYNSFSSSILL